MSAATRMERRAQRVKQNKHESLLFVAEILMVLVLAVLVRSYVFSLTTVQGPSMQDTLHSGQIVGVDKLYYRLHPYARGQVVICHYPDSGEYYVKRILALEGDTIEISNGVTSLNGVPLAESYVTHIAVEDFAPYTVPEDSVFVLGDNRANSHDSRAEGALTTDQIVGRVFAVLYPFNQAHWFETYEAAP